MKKWRLNKFNLNINIGIFLFYAGLCLTPFFDPPLIAFIAITLGFSCLLLLFPVFRSIDNDDNTPPLLKPFIWLAGWLVMRDLKKWARTPHIFDTAMKE